MIYIDFSDKVIERGKNNRIVKYTRLGTKTVLWGGLGVLVLNGTIGLKFLGEITVIALANKGTKYLIRNRKRLIHI